MRTITGAAIIMALTLVGVRDESSARESVEKCRASCETDTGGRGEERACHRCRCGVSVGADDRRSGFVGHRGRSADGTWYVGALDSFAR